MLSKSKFIFALIFIAGLAALCRPAAALGTGPLTGVEKNGNALILNYEHANARITFLEKNIVEVELSADGLANDMPVRLTAPDMPASVPFESRAAEGAHGVYTGAIMATYESGAFGLSLLPLNGVAALEIPADGVSYEPDGSYKISFKKNKTDHYLGLGEPMPDVLGQVVSYDLKGKMRTIWNVHVPPSDLGAPFFYNPGGGYGLFIENPWRAAFQFGGGGDTFAYTAQGGPLRFYYIYGPDLYSVLDGYTALTGRAPMPPRWATGLLQSRFGYKNEADFRDLMDNYRSRRIPCDTLIFDLDWFPIMGDLWWNPANFQDGSAFMKQLDSRGFKAIVIVEPYIFKDSSSFEIASRQNLFTRGPDGKNLIFPFWSQRPAGLMDFTNPDLRQWFGDKIARIHDSGVDAWWTDLDEPETDPEDNSYALGPRAAYHNLQAFLMNKTIFDTYAERYPDERVMIMTRSGFPGIQRFGSGIWSGDVQATFHHLENQTPIGLSASMSGFAMWNSDIGGFHGKPSPELFARWIQFGSFNPVFRPHGNHDRREPWAFGAEAEAINKKYIELRYRLAPYLYSLFRQMNQKGAPIMRPMFAEFPNDEQAAAVESQYMYGPLLLVAPVARPGETKHRVYLPAGDWTFFWNERTVSGPKFVSVPVDLETMPLFARPGALLPMGPVMQFTNEKPTDPLTIHYYPADEETQFTLYEDDGVTNAYKNGAFAETLLRGQRRADGTMFVTVEGPKGSYNGMPETRTYELVFHHAAAPAQVLLNREPVEKSKFEYDAEKQILTVGIPDSKGNFTVEAAF